MTSQVPSPSSPLFWSALGAEGAGIATSFGAAGSAHDLRVVGMAVAGLTPFALAIVHAVHSWGQHKVAAATAHIPRVSVMSSGSPATAATTPPTVPAVATPGTQAGA